MERLVAAAEHVVFDFDGPLCRLFSGVSVEAITERLLAIADERACGLDLPRSDGPFAVLRRVVGHSPSGPLARELAAALVEEELRAAPRAWPTAYADGLVMTLAATGRILSVASDNAPEAVREYLADRRLGHLFAGRVHGRDPDASLLKPDPSCVLRAVETAGVPTERTLMIGDSGRDAIAARKAGTAFLGYARNDRKRADLLEAGVPPEHLVSSLLPVLEAVSVADFAKVPARRATGG
ncbi:HAD hydrolase-like protein [Streptomyces sp. 549]|uniref:HAD family hydrolase n=1 Tax=Streptomyces sp. 549 TaxID=3049076 RepID=UPI0024C37C1F|nr:HAD family hydrolase [Streptomyces sp. 549]MDK1476193.1 HAD hydrolase-like protein [Streptomyces sp. 549]